jgi:hypothetical protein
MRYLADHRRHLHLLFRNINVIFDQSKNVKNNTAIAALALLLMSMNVHVHHPHHHLFISSTSLRFFKCPNRSFFHPIRSFLCFLLSLLVRFIISLPFFFRRSKLASTDTIGGHQFSVLVNTCQMFIIFARKLICVEMKNIEKLRAQ